MRTETIERVLYAYDELSDDAKSAARDALRETQCDNDWYGFVYEDAERVADILGIEIAQKQVPLMGGTTRSAPRIWFNGFWSQGDGACFEGSYAYKKGAARAIREYAPQDETLHRIADALQALQKPRFYRLKATCAHSGRYYHSGCMSFCVWLADCGFRDVDADTEDALTELLREFADWIYNQLEAEHDYLTSDDAIAESIEANGYEFDGNGALA